MGVRCRDDQLVVTAANCLPFFPPCFCADYHEGKTYKGLLAPLGGKPAVGAEWLFADPITDIAVLGRPYEVIFFEEADAYEALLEPTTRPRPSPTVSTADFALAAFPNILRHPIHIGASTKLL